MNKDNSLLIEHNTISYRAGKRIMEENAFKFIPWKRTLKYNIKKNFGTESVKTNIL